MCAANRKSGFTLFEVLIVIGIGTLLLSLTLPIGLRFYQVQVADEAGEGVLSALRNAETAARHGKHDSSFGVKFLSDRYVLFEGVSYALRTTGEDQLFVLPSGAAVTSTYDEVVFLESTGRVSATGTVSTEINGRARTFFIEQSGVISELN